MKKKIRALVISFGIVAFIVALVVVINRVNNGRLVAELESVEMLNYGYMGDSLESTGVVISDASQQIYLDEKQTVTEVFVKEGDIVKKGDKLLSYDISGIELSLEAKKLNIKNIENRLAKAQRDLKKLKTIKPVTITPEPEMLPTPTEALLEKKDGENYNYIDKGFVPSKGDEENKVEYLCSAEVFLTGSFLNSIAGENKQYIFIVQDESKKELMKFFLDAKEVSSDYPDDLKWYIFMAEPATDEIVSTENDNEELDSKDGYNEFYSSEDLSKAVNDKLKEIKELDLELRTEQLKLKSMEAELKDGVVYAKIDGTVQKACEPENPPTDGSVFLSVIGQGGLCVKGAIDELNKDKLSEGQQVYCIDYESGNSCIGSIVSIDAYPTDTYFYYGESNPNSSHYMYTAKLEDTEGFTDGQYVSMSVDMGSEETEGIYIEKCYIKNENGKSYVYKDDNGVLKKQYVETGRTIWGSAVEIISGISMDDYLAFPYGNTAKEGVKTKTSDWE